MFDPKSVIHTVDKKQVLLVLPLSPLPFKIRPRLQKYFKNYSRYCLLKVVY